MDPYYVSIVILGVALLGAAWLPSVVSDRPLSLPIIYVAFGYGVFNLPLPLDAPDPLAQSEMAEHLAELGVIIALTSAALKLDRHVGLTEWSSTWRLLAVTMPLCIAGAALLGWGIGGLAPASAVLLGAALAPTDPVLASDVQATPPGESGLEESEVRFALTSEAGLNDGLAFPFTNAAIAMAVAGPAPSEWIGEWLLEDVLLKIGVGVGLGLLIGRFIGYVLFNTSYRTGLKRPSAGLLAVVVTLLAYGATEMAHGYGFLAVFIAASSVRHREREHDYHEILHNLSEQAERTLMVIILVLFGGSLASGLLAPLTLPLAVTGLLFLLVVRPAAGLLAMSGYTLSKRERFTISFFGIRGIGSFFYLAFALNEADFPGAEMLWALVGFVVVVSIVLHGVLATPIIHYVDARTETAQPEARKRL